MSKTKNKPKTLQERGFIFKEKGCKKCYGIYHKDCGDQLLGWIGKNCTGEEKGK